MSLSLLLTATNQRNRRSRWSSCSAAICKLFCFTIDYHKTSWLIYTFFPLKILPLDKSALEQLSNNRGRQSNIIEDVGHASQALDAVAHLIVSHERHVAPTFRPTMPSCRMSLSTSVHLSSQRLWRGWLRGQGYSLSICANFSCALGVADGAWVRGIVDYAGIVRGLLALVWRICHDSCWEGVGAWWQGPITRRVIRNL